MDKNISDCQMGARKAKGCKNNIFVVNGIIHEVLKSKNMKPVVLQIYDYQQMFDSINLQEALSDIFNVGVNDDTLKSTDEVISNASCTTNCLAPLAKALHEGIGTSNGHTLWAN